MKENLPDPKDAGLPEATPAEPGKVKLARWQALADFRTRSAHQRMHRPAARIRYSAFLRNAAFGLAFLSQAVLQPAAGGTITGNVHAEGKSGADAGNAAGGGDIYGSRKYKFIQRMDYAAMRDFVVYVEGNFGTNVVSTNVEEVATTKVAQQEARFTPHVLPVMVGTKVEWPNNDEIYHNVFSYSDAASFDLGLYKGHPTNACVTFTNTGKVDVYCSIHTDMHCIVLVLDNPYFTTSDADGNYTIQNVPPGTYKLKAWHDRLPPDEREIVVPTNGVVKADFTLTIKNLPEPEMKNPHAILKASFRAKVLTSFVICLVVIMTVTLLIEDQRITAQSEREARNTLATANSVFLSSEKDRTRYLLERFRSLDKEPRYRAAFKAGDAVSLGTPMHDLMMEQDVSFVFYTAVEYGRTKILDAEEREPQLAAPAFEFAAKPAVDEALQDQRVTDTVRVDKQLYDVIAVPVHDADATMLGVLVIGTRLGPNTAQDFSQITGSHIALVADGHVVASTLSGAKADAQFASLFKNLLIDGRGVKTIDGGVQPVELDGEHYYGTAGRFNSLGGDTAIGYVLLNSNEEALRSAAEAKQLLLLFGLAAILIGAAVVWVLIKRVTQPLLELRDNAVAVGSGDFSRRVPVRGRDEFGQLASAFNQMTEDMQQSHAELEQTVTTLQNTQQQLIQSEKLSAVGEFVAGVAHELNNPLAAVMGFSEMLKDSDPNSKNRRHLEIIHKSAERCQKIVQSLLSFARRQKPERKPVQVQQIVEAVLEIVSYPLRTSNIDVVTQFDSTAPYVHADSHQIQQVVLNIINNARQAIEEHGTRPRGQIKIITEASAETVRIIIQDNGPGIPDENLRRIFDPFFTTKKVGVGTGLGLSLCYGMVQEHGGSITALNRPSGGAMFIIELPAMQLPGDTTELTRSDKRCDSAADEGAGKRILVIDDELPILDMLSESLVAYGYEVDKTNDGRNALELLAQNDYDATLCDWKMPGLNGRQVYEHLRDRKPEACRRFIFISGDVVNETMSGFLEQESRTCLSKPFTLTDVREAIRCLTQQLELQETNKKAGF